MADPGDYIAIATHAGSGVGGAGIVAALMRWVAGKEAGELRTEMALMRQKLDDVAKVLEKHADLGERVALLEASVKAAHERLDGRSKRR